MQMDEIGGVQTLRMSDGNVLKFEYANTVASVAAIARSYAQKGYPDRYVIFAENQTDTALTGAKLKEGETQHGIFMSCILRPSMFPSQASFLPPMSAVAVASAIETHTDREIGIGWVSDIYCNGHKIGGTAIEGKLDSFSSYEYIIITFALRITKEDFPERLSDMVKQVFGTGNTSIPTIIAKDILNKFFTLYATARDSAKFMDYYGEKFLLRGKRITYFEAGKKRHARILGVDTETAALTLEDKGEIIHYRGSPKNVILPEKIKLKRNK